jgi:hypothetical protein
MFLALAGLAPRAIVKPRPVAIVQVAAIRAAR